MADDLLKAALLERAKREMAARQAKQPEIGEDGLPDPNTGLGRAMRAVRNPINAVNRAFSNMYTLGSLDEIEGAADAAMTNQSFSDARQASRSRSDQQRAEYPVMTTAAGLAGAVASPAGQLAARAIPATGGLMSRIGGGMIGGGGLGAVQGFMEGDSGVGNRLASAGRGLLAGGAVGGAVPAIASGVGLAYRGARNALAARGGMQQIADDLGISRRAAGLTADVVGMDDLTRMRTAINDAGQDAMLADAGPTTRNALDFVTQAPGEGARTALRRIDDRAAAAGGRLNDALDQSLTGNGVGSPGGRQFSDTTRLQGDVRQATAPARQAIYDAAYSKPIDYASQQGRALLDDISPRLPQEVVGYANKLMRMKGEKSAQIMASIADDGTVTFTNPPDVRQWDYIKRALDGLAETSEGTGALGAQTTMGGAFKSLARDIRTNLGQAVPEYDYAVNTAGDIIGEIKAIKTGETLLRDNVTRAEAEAALDGMSKVDRAAVKRGLRVSIDDAVANVKAIASDPNMDAREAYKSYQMLSGRAAQDKMKMLLEDDWPPLKKALDEAASALRLRASVGGNSKTGMRGEFKQMFDDALAPSRLATGENLGPMVTPRALLQNALGTTPSALQRAGAGVRSEIADLMTRPNGQNILATIERGRLAGAPVRDAGMGLRNALSGIGLSSVPLTAPQLRDLLGP